MKKIMIIDDNETNLKMMDLILSKAGFKTDTIINPKFAIDVITEAKPDLLLLDINMPEVNGFHICKEMKKNKDLAKIPVIFVSTLTNAEYIAGGLAMGAVDYITKPIKADEMKARVAVQLKIAETQKKMTKTNEILKKKIENATLENSDMQSDLIYSLMQIKKGEASNKDYQRISDFCQYIIKKMLEDSAYSDEIDEDFIIETLCKAFAS